jgi:hypothetical protein
MFRVIYILSYYDIFRQHIAFIKLVNVLLKSVHCTFYGIGFQPAVRVPMGGARRTGWEYAKIILVIAENTKENKLK